MNVQQSWPHFREIETMRSELEKRLTRDSYHRTPKASNPKPTPIDWQPEIELEETSEAFMVRVQVPGIDRKNLDIQLSDRSLSIIGDRHRDSNNSNRYRTEFRYGHFQRVLSFPVAIAKTRAQADLKDGILSLSLPKLSTVRPEVVKVSLGESNTPAPAPNPTPPDRETSATDSELTEDLWQA